MARLGKISFPLPVLLAGFILFAWISEPLWAREYCERLYESSRMDYYALLRSERKQRFHDSWDKVINKFATIADKYPQCSRAPDSLFNVGTLYRKLYRKSWVKRDLESAVEAFISLQKKYPRNNLADDALFAAAEIREELGDRKGAYGTYNDLVEKYPKGDMKGKARKKLKSLAAYAPKPVPKQKSVSPPSAVRVTDVKHWSNPDYTRVVVYTTGRPDFEKHHLRRDPKTGKPPRIYIDMKGTVVPTRLQNSIPVADGLLQQVRIAQYDPSTVRLVLDMKSLKESHAFAQANPPRLVVDIYGEKGKPPGQPRPAAIEDPGDKPLPLSMQLGLKVRKIVLDPGHGGRDPGAVGRKGLREKDVTLALARRLKPLLEAKGYEVQMTRTSDTFVELKDRTKFANDQQADLFISLHTNASRSRKVRGIETYFLGVARDRAASETAMLENAVSEIQVLSDLEQILLDLVNAENLRHSSMLAGDIQDSMYNGLRERFSNIKNLGVKQAPFFVLVNAEMPAILVETSFISNPSDERLLASKGYRDLLGQTIFKGILNYIGRLDMLAGRGG